MVADSSPASQPIMLIKTIEIPNYHKPTCAWCAYLATDYSGYTNNGLIYTVRSCMIDNQIVNRLDTCLSFIDYLKRVDDIPIELSSHEKTALYAVKYREK